MKAGPICAETHWCQSRRANKAGLRCHPKSGTVEVAQQRKTLREGRHSGTPAQFVFGSSGAIRRTVRAAAGPSALRAARALNDHQNQEEIHKTCWDPRTARGPPMRFSEEHFHITTCGFFFLKKKSCIKTCWRCGTTELRHPESPCKKMRKRAAPHWVHNM